MDDPSGPSIAYQGTWDALQTIKRTEGLAGIYKVREDLTGSGVPGGESPGCVVYVLDREWCSSSIMLANVGRTPADS